MSEPIPMWEDSEDRDKGKEPNYYLVPHCAHLRTWMEGGFYVHGEVCCKCDLIIDDPADDTDCPAGIGKESIG